MATNDKKLLGQPSKHPILGDKQADGVGLGGTNRKSEAYEDYNDME